LVALLGDSDLKSIRGVVEALGAWMGDARAAALFFDRPETAPGLAEQARVMAEMLEI
jgi:hypothetical protein